jgi:hypothetical protein
MLVSKGGKPIRGQPREPGVNLVRALGSVPNGDVETQTTIKENLSRL